MTEQDVVDFAIKYGSRALDVDAIARDAWKQGRPTDNAFAEYVWRASNHLPVDSAKRMMKRAGYVAFQGFPLKRMGW
jgi:hypothetical protein